MTWFTGFVAFLLVWWLVLFTVLPWGIRHDLSSNPGERSPGSPLNPNLFKKFLATTAITVVIWLLIYFVIQANFIDIRSASLEMIDRA